MLRSVLIAFGVVASVAAWSQQAEGGGGFETRFRQMDQNGDGSLNADELAGPELLGQLDRDGGQKVSVEEARAWGERRQGATGQTPVAPTRASNWCPPGFPGSTPWA